MNSWRIIEGDCRDVLASLPERSVHTCVTSPPYFGLRDYGHDGQIGLEPTPDEFVAALVDVFRGVRRVLRDDGTVWLNLGDSYNVGTNADRPATTTTGAKVPASWSNRNQAVRRTAAGCKPKDLLGIPWMVAFALRADGWYLRSDIIWSKPNPMPESVTDRPTKAHEYVFLLSKGASYFYDADAIREDGKPESAARYDYAFGAGPKAATALDVSENGLDRRTVPIGEREFDGRRNKRSVWTVATQPFSDWTETVRRVRVEADADVDGKKRTTSPDCPLHGDRPVPAASARGGGRVDDASNHTPRSDAGPARGPLDALAPTGRPLEPSSADGSSGSPPLAGSPTATARSTESHRTASRSASGDTACEGTNGRTEGTSPSHETPAPDGSGSPDSSRTRARTSRTCTCEHYIEITEKTSHFATFPPKLIEPCILAGCPEGGTVLDPFAGSGTTGMVALRHNRSFVGVELSPVYAAMARWRIRDDSPLLNSVAEAVAA